MQAIPVGPKLLQSVFDALLTPWVLVGVTCTRQAHSSDDFQPLSESNETNNNNIENGVHYTTYHTHAVVKCIYYRTLLSAYTTVRC